MKRNIAFLAAAFCLVAIGGFMRIEFAGALLGVIGSVIRVIGIACVFGVRRPAARYKKEMK